MIEFDSGNHLYKRVCRIVFGVNLLHFDISIFKDIPHKVVLDINMLRPSMIDLIFRKVAPMLS